MAFKRRRMLLVVCVAILCYVIYVTINRDSSLLVDKGPSLPAANREIHQTPHQHEPPHRRKSETNHRRNTGTNIVIIGSGPSALGAARRLHDLKQEENNNVTITILEELGQLGGQTTSIRDDKGFLWDAEAPLVFSHYTYFDRVLNMAVPEWNYRHVTPFAFMKTSDGVRKFIPYPVQNNIQVMDKKDQSKCLSGLKQIKTKSKEPRNFDEWLLRKFGIGLADVFMRKFYKKVWTMNTKKLNWAWTGEIDAAPDIAEVIDKINQTDKGTIPKSVTGRYFRYPKYNGTGGIWKTVAKKLPIHWFKLGQKITRIDIDKKEITVELGTENKTYYTQCYDTLISTVPLDRFTGYLRSNHPSLTKMKDLSSQLVYTHTHIVGVGLKGQPPEVLVDKSWLYFPDSDSPCYRVTMLSSLSDDHVPKKGHHWSLLCEIAEPYEGSNPSHWTRDILLQEAIQSLVSYGLITADKVVSKHYRRLDHGYPVPSLKRDRILETIQPWLESRNIYSRGRFGGWRYEVANQDHSFMQGVEAVDKIVQGIPEVTYPDASRAVLKKHTDRVIPKDYEFVVAHYNENLGWLRPHANRTLVYHKGHNLGPPFQLYGWEKLPNVGRESHSYLYHISTYYDHLADVTVFVQGDHLSGKCFKNINKFVSSAKRGVPCVREGIYRKWGRIGFTAKKLRLYNKTGTPVIRTEATFGQMYQDLYGSPPPRRGIPFCFNGCFGATREMIRKHPLEFYQKALTYVNTISNPEEGHYFERLWYHMMA